MSNFRLVDRDTGFLMPPSVDEWLPERHLARFVVEIIEKLDLRAMTSRYRGSGEKSYHPTLLLGLIIYGYATGVFSSRRLERATYDAVAFRFIATNEHPDHDTIANFRRRFLKQIEALFVQVLSLAQEMGGAGKGSAKRSLVESQRRGAQAWHGGARWHQDSRQRQPPQRTIPRARDED